MNLELFTDLPGISVESNDYLTKQLITYLGNKRALLDFLGVAVAEVKKKLDKEKLNIFDVFSGSGIVSRYFKKDADNLISNDLEDYSRVINNCYLANRAELDEKLLHEIFDELKYRTQNIPVDKGFIQELYSPENDDNIRVDERVFYTPRNAAYLDTARVHIEKIPAQYRNFFLGPLLSEASIHANTSGVFKGFYKNMATGVGQFGGNNRDALSRIKGDIELNYPLFSNFECSVTVLQGDANEVAETADEVDLAYLDPPYNQHPYGSNYFMLNLLVNYIKPEIISAVSGIPDDWNRSRYNQRRNAVQYFLNLAETLKAKYLLVSFNSEGFISLNEMKDLLAKVGTVKVLETRYNTFRGSRNLRNREIHVKEYLYLVKKR